jgi:hypothetical protein
MNVIRPTCRSQFSEEDFNFILGALGSDGDECFLHELLIDPETRDLILDHENLAVAILDNPGCIHISPHLYFYVLVRQTMKRTGIDDRELTDYVAEVLAAFLHPDSPGRSLPAQVRDSSYLFEMFAALQGADEPTSFQIRAHIGNRSLFLTGMFLEHLKERTRRRGAPDITYYEQMGAASFRAASRNRLADKFEVAAVYNALGDCFHETRLALNKIADRHLMMGDPPPPAGLFLN